MSNYWPRHVYARAFFLESLKDHPDRSMAWSVAPNNRYGYPKKLMVDEAQIGSSRRRSTASRIGTARQIFMRSGGPGSPGTYNPQQKKTADAMSTMGREADELARVRRARELRSNGRGSNCRCSFCGGSFPAER